MLNKPSQLNFYRLVLGITSPFAWVSLWESLLLAQKLGISPLASKTWFVLLSAMALLGGISLILFVLSFTRLVGPVEKFTARVGSIGPAIPEKLRWAGYPILLIWLAAYPLTTLNPYYGSLLSKQNGIRSFLFWLIALVGMQALKMARPRLQSQAALLITILMQACIVRISLYLPDVNNYPFAMGWSETSRFYYPALFMGKAIFGERLAWPILHPSLHFVLAPPYLLNLPLWFHRLWQVGLRFLLVGLIAPALMYRLKISTRSLRWVGGLWIFLVLFTLPLYLHLAVPVFILLWGFSTTNDRRTWTWLVLASIWAGVSRINWYPMPGMLAAALYFLEVPYDHKGWRFLIKPALWSFFGTIIAFLSMQSYIAISGITNSGDFFTSLNSSLLWDRLWPNASYALGVLPGIVIFSIPFWLVIFFSKLERLPRLMLLSELLILFAGGVVVSMKIGGGADIHNMDAYAVLLLIISAYILTGQEIPQADKRPNVNLPGNVAWGAIALLVLVPAWFSTQSKTEFWQYDANSSQKTLAALQQEVDQVNAQGGEILFITQRHLISMHMLKGVNLSPEYEREELMEMAMSRNDAHLQKFRSDMEKHRYAAIIVDPLRYNFVGEQDAMGVENNAWTRYVVKKILCNYQQSAVFPSDRIAIYVPQVDGQKCP